MQNLHMALDGWYFVLYIAIFHFEIYIFNCANLQEKSVCLLQKTWPP